MDDTDRIILLLPLIDMSKVTILDMRKFWNKENYDYERIPDYLDRYRVAKARELLAIIRSEVGR